MDAHKNFAYSTIATAPDPPTSGTSLIVQTGHGSRFPTVPFNALIWPRAVQPTVDNAEIVRVTAISSDTFTITRAQEGTSARTHENNAQIAQTITAKTLTDIEDILGPPLVIDAGSTSNAATITTTGAINTSHRYDANNRYDVSVSSAGLVTHEAVGASAGHRFNDPVGFNTAPSTGVAVNLQPSALTGTNQAGINLQLVASSGATGNARGMIAQVLSANAAYNIGAITGILVETPTLQGAATATDNYGIYVKPQTRGSAFNYGIYVEAPSGGSNINTGIKVNGGDVGINVTNEMTGANTTKAGISTNVEFNDSTATGYAYFAQPTTMADSFTLTNRYAFYADMSLKGAGSTITNDYGLYISAVTQGGTSNYAIFTNAGKVSFGGDLELRAAAVSTSSTYVSLGISTQSTVGAAGAASALPATPSGYLRFFIGSTEYVLPYYLQA